MSLRRFCFALDLKSDPQLIAEYKKYHEQIWPEVHKSIIDSGIRMMEIYLLENRLFMIVEADDGFSLETKQKMDARNVMVQKWEELMWRYQQPLPRSKKGDKWRLMECIFSLKA
jgi:L-rhamnose mutarotase